MNRILSTYKRLAAISLIFLIVGSLALPLVAETPDAAGARQFAETFFRTSAPQFAPGKIQSPELQKRYQSASFKQTPVFVFQNSEKGFAVVAQRNNNFAVVGYAPDGKFMADSMPEQLKVLLRLYEDSLKINPAASPKTVSGTPVATPLLDRAGIWLNQFSHEEVGGCPTGCVATAFTQIMAYYKHPSRGQGSHCYTHGSYGQLCADFGNTTYNWDNPTFDDFKLLSYHTGIAMDMNYCESSFGSAPSKWGYEKAMQTYFKYYLNNGSTASEYLMNEIDHLRPVYIELPGTPGHALVLDGYDSEGLFHLNFGWGGQYNGYYVLNSNSTFFVGYKFGTNISAAYFLTPTPLHTNEQDSLALVAVNNALGSTTGWDLTQPVSTWQGVTTMNGRVIALNLNNGSYFTYKGTIPPEIGNLTALQTLNLLGQFDGTLPATVSNLIQLKNLNIYSGSGTLKVTLPGNIGNMVQLESIQIPYKCEGAIPSSIGSCTNLTILDLNSGNITGTIPAETGNLKRLKTLNLRKNQLSGDIPSGLANLTVLTEIYLDENQLTGTLPANIGNLKNLLVLTLNDNQLSGTLPASLGNCSRLTTLLLHNNRFTGAMPASFGNMTDINNLNISNNQLSALPDEMGNWSKLEDLKLNNNHFTSLPVSINKLVNLKTLNVSRNRISVLPDNFGFFPSLTAIDLSFNELNEFPDAICQIPKLQTAGFRKNKIEKFPPSITMLPVTLSYLALDSNEISGKIPAELLENGKIVPLLLSHNRFTFEDIPVSTRLKNQVGNQKPVKLNKQIFKAGIGDTINIDIRQIAPFTLETNQYNWISADKNKAVGITPNPILTVIIDDKTIHNKYFCQVTNPQSPAYSFTDSGNTYTFPCLNSVNTDTISFQLASEEELISEKYNGGYVVSTNNIPAKTIEDQIVTLVPPLKARGIIRWQASADGKTWYDLTETMSQSDLKANFVSVKQQELILSPKTPAYYRCSVQDVNCAPLYSDTLKVNPFGRVLFDGTLNAATEARTIKADSIEVTLPAGIYDKDFRLTIVKLDNPPAAPEGMKMSSAYDVTVSFGSVFETPILIRFNNLDKQKIAHQNIRNFRPVYFDDAKHQWIPYESGGLSLRDSTIVFETNHLTKLSWWWDEETFLWGFTDYFASGNIFVYYKESDVKHMQAYASKQTLQDWHSTDETPWYIQDIAHFLSEVMTSFGKLGLPVPSSDFRVYVDSIADDGTVGISGMVNGYIMINRKIDNPEKLRSLMAHEFMHYVQDSYIAASNGGNLFWMEAHAHLSDRLVWDDTVIPVSESEHYLLDGRTHKDNIYKFLSNSWDFEDRNALGQKVYGVLTHCYQAGTFLHYMRSYREGEKKLKPDVLLKETSYTGSWRSYLDSYIKTHLQSTIGDEYEGYLKYILGGTNKKFTLLDLEGNNPFSYMISFTRDKHFSEKIVYRFDKDNSAPQEDKINYSIPYLASKVLLLYNSTDDRAMVVNCKRLHKTDDNNKIYYGRYDIKTKQTVYTDISDSTSYNIFIEARNEQSVKKLNNICFLLFINKKNPSKTDIWTDFDVSMELTATPVYDIEYLYSGWIAGAYGNNLFVHTYSKNKQYAYLLSGIHLSGSGQNEVSHDINYYSSSRSEISDSAYVVNISFGDETRHEYPEEGALPGIQITEKQIRIFYNFVKGTMKINSKAKFVNKFETVYEEKPRIIHDSDWYYDTYLALKNLNTMKITPVGEYLMFETLSSAETQAVVDYISDNHREIRYNPETGKVISTEYFDYISTDYSGGDVVLKLMFKIK